MPITLAPRQPKLLTPEMRIPSAEMEASSSKAQQTIKAPAPKKSVSFYEIVTIRSTIHMNDMTDEEVDNAWYNRREMLSIKRTRAIEVKYMMNNKQMIGPDRTARGLEYRTREGSEKRRANKFNSIHAVLDEQDIQLLRGMNEPEGLRRIYLQHSERCLAEAQVLGKNDALEAKLIYGEYIARASEFFSEQEDDVEDMEVDEPAEAEAQPQEVVAQPQPPTPAPQPAPQQQQPQEPQRQGRPQKRLSLTSRQKQKRDDSEEQPQRQTSSKRDNLFMRLFTKKRAVMEEIKQLQATRS